MHSKTLLRPLLQTATLLLCSLNLAHAGEPPTEPILRFDLGVHTAAITRIASDDAGRYVVTASLDKTARVWRVADGQLLSTLRIPIGSGDEGKLNAVALSPDGQTVALGGWTGWDYDGSASIFLFDRASGRLLRRLTGLPDVIFRLAFNPDGRSLAATLGGNNGLRLFSVADGRLLAQDTDYAAVSSSVQFSPRPGKSQEQRLVTTSWDGALRLYRWDGSQLTLLAKRSAPGGSQPYAARFSPDGRQIAVGFNDTPAVNVLHAADLSFDYAPDTAGVKASLGNVAWSLQGDFLYAGGLAQAPFDGRWQFFIRRWPTHGNGAYRDDPVAGNSLMDLLPLSGGRLLFGSQDPSWGLLNAQGTRTLFHAPVGADFRDNQAGFTLSADGTQVRFGYELFGKSPAVFDSQRRAFVAEQALNAPLLSAPGLNITDWEYTTAPKLNGSPLKLRTHETSRSLTLLPDGSGFALGTEWFLRLFNRNGTQRWEQAAPGIVLAVNVSQDGRWVVAAYGDGTIRWHRASDGVEQLAFFPHADKKRWVLWTPNGYFDASPGAENFIGWHLNQGKDKEARYVKGGQLYSALYRPDLIQRVVSGEDYASLPKVDLAKMLASGDAPLIQFTAPGAGASTSRDVTLKYRVCDAGGGIGKRVLRMNGITIALAEGDRALKRVGGAQAQAQNCLDEERLISLQPGTNTIALTAFNKTGEIESVPVELKLALAGGAGGASGGKPTLHVLTLAIDKYRDGDLHLKYPTKDAEGLVSQLKAASGTLFREIKVHALVNDNVRRGQIGAVFDELAKTVQPEDVFVFYVAGHGVTDREDGNYYFLPVDFRYSDATAVRKQALSNAFFQENLAKVRAGKSLVLLDTCNSGSFQAVKTRGVEEKTAVERLVKSTGRATLMASSSSQVALEGYRDHGVFTWVLMEGLRGKAVGRDKQITVGSLADYVSETLPELTYKQFGYEQVPQRELQGMNFPIGVR